MELGELAVVPNHWGRTFMGRSKSSLQEEVFFTGEILFRSIAIVSVTSSSLSCGAYAIVLLFGLSSFPVVFCPRRTAFPFAQDSLVGALSGMDHRMDVRCLGEL